MWQVFSADVRGWGVAQNAKYGAAIGVATTVGGLITGRSVRLLGNRLHTLAWTLSTALSNLMFMSPSTRVAMGSVVFAGAEDCMQAAANARLVQAGSALGMRKGQLAADYGNLLACVRVAGLYLFGKLCAVGMKAGVPQLPYVICMGLQLLAAALIFLIPSTEWLDSGGPDDDDDETCVLCAETSRIASFKLPAHHRLYNTGGGGKRPRRALRRSAAAARLLHARDVDAVLQPFEDGARRVAHRRVAHRRDRLDRARGGRRGERRRAVEGDRRRLVRGHEPRRDGAEDEALRLRRQRGEVGGEERHRWFEQEEADGGEREQRDALA